MVNAAFVLRASGPVDRDPDVEADGVPLDAPAWSLIDPASTGSVRDPALSLSVALRKLFLRRRRQRTFACRPACAAFPDSRFSSFGFAVRRLMKR